MEGSNRSSERTATSGEQSGACARRTFLTGAVAVAAAAGCLRLAPAEESNGESSDSDGSAGGTPDPTGTPTTSRTPDATAGTAETWDYDPAVETNAVDADGDPLLVVPPAEGATISGSATIRPTDDLIVVCEGEAFRYSEWVDPGVDYDGTFTVAFDLSGFSQGTSFDLVYRVGADEIFRFGNAVMDDPDEYE